MNDKEKYVIDLGYGAHGLPHVERLPGARLSAAKHENRYTVTGNAEGLLFLAHHLVALATMPARPEHAGYHVHLDDLYELNEEGVEFVLRKIE